MHAEVGPVHAGEVEQVADEPLEPLGLDRDGRGRLARFDRTVVERLGVAADCRQRRLQLVTDREQERPLGLAGACQLLREVVERGGERRELGRALDRHRLGPRSAREAPARLRDAADRTRDAARQQQRGRGGERGTGERGDEQGLDEGLPTRGGHALRPQQDEGLGAHTLRREVVVAAADSHRPLRRPPLRERVSRRLRQGSCVEPVGLVLLGEDRPHGLQVRERRHRDALPGDDQRRLVGDVLQSRLVDGPPREHQAETERQADAQHDDQQDRLEEPCAKGSQAAMSLYPEPRTVRIVSASPSLRRSCATWTSTVRVPPG